MGRSPAAATTKLLVNASALHQVVAYLQLQWTEEGMKLVDFTGHTKANIQGFIGYGKTQSTYDGTLQKKSTLLIEPSMVEKCFAFWAGFSAIVLDIFQHARQW